MQRDDGIDIRGVLFDKDGTLFDFFTVWVPAYREAAAFVTDRMQNPERLDELLRAGGLDPNTDRVTSGSVLASGTNDEIVEAWRGVAGDAWRSELDQHVHRILHEHASGTPAPVAPLAPLFEALKRHGVRIGVATMDSRAAAEGALRSANVRELVDLVIGHDTVEHHKPAPDMVQLFAKTIGLPTNEIVMVGDSAIDLQMGRAADVGLTVGVLSGPSTEPDLAPWADFVIPSVAALVACLFPNE